MTKPKVHFIGIGGIGTSALARWFLSHNYNVSGSDISSSEIISELKKQGIKISLGHKRKNVPRKTNLVIFSAAVPPNNPERLQAAKLGIPAKSYSEAVGDLVKKYKTLAVAGAHGKSTATALLSLVLIKAGLDPMVIIGTKLKEFGGSTSSPQGNNFRKGKGDYLVLEADEYHHSFLNYSPFAAIILNIDKEHLDYYRNLAAIKNAFLKFINNVQRNGILILNRDDKNLFSLKSKIQKIVKKNNLKIYWYSRRSRIFTNLNRILKIPGEHNVYNALAVYTLAKALKIKNKDIFAVLSRYQGAWRRMQYRGRFIVHDSSSKIQVFDDYAHHPAEIRATLAGIARKWPKTAKICVFQPHQAQRLSALFKGFTGAFFDANYLVLLPIFQVEGRDVSQNRGYHNAQTGRHKTSKKLAEAIQKRTNQLKTSKLKTVVYLPSPQNLRNILEKIIHDSRHPHYIIVMMGAGDIYKLTDKLVK